MTGPNTAKLEAERNELRARVRELECEVECYAKQHRLRAGCLQQERANNARLRAERDALKAEVERWREACNEGIGECGMLQEADGCDRERLETPEQVRDRLRAISEHFDDCTQEYERILGQQKRIGELKAEVERLTRQNAAYLLQRDSSRELRDRAQNEVERLRALVKSAFDEGMQAGGQGEYDYSPHAVDRCWAESCVKSELEDGA